VGVPLAALAPLFLVFWATLFLHFRPREGTMAGLRANPFLRGAFTFVGAAFIFLLAWQWALFTNNVPLNGPDGRMNEIAPFFGFEAAAIVFLYYLSLRFFPVIGVAVCRRSFRSGEFLSATHGWNIFGLIAILILLSAVLIFMQVIIQSVTLSAAYAVVAQALEAVGAFLGWDPQLRPTDWIAPVVAWAWLIVRILYNVFWVFFSYGVLGGLLGRLYRETIGDPVGPTIWMKRG
ncbi:MAG: hypothetical protein K2Q06_03020, partial [Parvularculaceae bacterium]|nr:hypothetical protein [Parvularculaceae bacterium]